MVSVSERHSNILHEIAEREGFQNYITIFDQGSSKGDGYMGEIIFVHFEEKLSNKTLHLVLKAAHRGEKLRENIPVQIVFERENFMYRTIFKEFTKLQNEFEVKEKFDGFAKYYGGLTELNEECLVLENLRMKSFTLWNRKTPMDPEHVGAVMAQYGKFHALSYALKTFKPEVYEDKTKNFLNSMDDFFLSSDSKTLFTSTLQKVYRDMGDDVTNDLNRYEKLFETLGSIKSKDIDKNSVILHGDCWCNNFMFHYQDSTKKKPSKVCMLDWQASSNGSPFRDLSYFFYTSSSEECLQNYVAYLEIYYSSLSEMLQQFGVRIEKIMTLQEVLNEWKNYAGYGLIFAVYLFKVMLSEQTEIIEIGDVPKDRNLIHMFDKNISNIDEYNKRVWSIIKHMVANGFV